MTTDLPPLRHLSAADVEAAMPALEERLALAELTMTALVADAELPAKIAVHPRPSSSFAHAMPAFLRGRDPGGSGDRLGMKWVLGVPANVDAGLPAIHGLVLLNDPLTGLPLAILDAGPITAQRTAAVSGVAIRAFRPRVDDHPPRAALIGAGVQGRSHLPVIGHVLPGAELAVFDRDRGRADALAAAARETSGIAACRVAADPREATAGADVVVTAASFGPQRQVMNEDWLAPGALVVPIDYDMHCSAALVGGASLFLVDHRDQYLATRAGGAFTGWPDPDAMIGEALLDATPRPEGLVIACHLGVGLADVVFGAAILAAAEERGLGTLLPR